MSEYIHIGKLVAVHGVAGEAILKHSLGKSTTLKGVTALYLEEKKDCFIPYFIEQVRSRSADELLIRFEGIRTREAMAALIPTRVWLTEEDFRKHSAQAAPISLLGYTLLDGDTLIGTVTEVIEQPHQILCTVLYKGKEALIPLHGESLLQIDRKNRVIHVELPEGLLDIYSGE